MSVEESPALSPENERRLFWLTLISVFVILAILAGVSYVIWPRTNTGKLIWEPEKGIIIVWVPVAILEWAFAGGMVGVLYRLAYRIRIRKVGIELYTWAIAKPVIAIFMGSLVYFIALGAGKLLGVPSESIKDQVLWLNVVAFIGGFSDELSIGLINRLVARALGQQTQETRIIA